MFGFKKKKFSGNNDRSIYELIKKSIGDSGELPHNFNLPSNSNGKLKFAAGAMDGIRTRHSELKGSECGELYGLVKKYNGDISAIEDFFNENHALETADSFFEETAKRGGIKPFQLSRLACGLTQEELADRCELTKGYISQLENDLTSPSIATLIDILSALGTNINL